MSGKDSLEKLVNIFTNYHSNELAGMDVTLSTQELEVTRYKLEVTPEGGSSIVWSPPRLEEDEFRAFINGMTKSKIMARKTAQERE